MDGKFIFSRQLRSEDYEWGATSAISGPVVTAASNLVVLHVTFLPGQGHNFHKHPDQEEVIYILEGEVEQWIGQDMKRLGPGDSAFIPAGTVHASFNPGSSDVMALAILSPAIGSTGYSVVEVADQVPWSQLRKETTS